eukprot:2589815-Rhodomonas_salina.1
MARDISRMAVLQCVPVCSIICHMVDKGNGYDEDTGEYILNFKSKKEVLSNPHIINLSGGPGY